MPADTAATMPALFSNKMEVGLVRDQLCRGDVLDSNRAMRSIRDNGISGGVVMGRSQKRIDICEHGLAELDGVRCRCKVCDSGLTKIRCEHEIVVFAD